MDVTTGVEGSESFDAAVVQPNGKVAAASSAPRAGPATPTWSWSGTTRTGA